MKLKAVFLDKDGSLLPQIPGNAPADSLTLNEGLVEGLQLLQSYGYLLVVVSNQQEKSPSFKEPLNYSFNPISTSCSRLGIYLDGFYYPSETQKDLSGRDSTATGELPNLLQKAAGDMDIDLTRSWIVGELPNDVEAGERTGCKTILISENGHPNKKGDSALPQFQAKDLAEAARYILKTSHKSPFGSGVTVA